MNDGMERKHRIDSDLLDVRLIIRAAVKRACGDWEQHHLARDPEAVIVSAKGKPTFFYSKPVAAFSLRASHLVAETRLHGSLVQHALYDRTGSKVDEARELRGDARWN
jgi:hypothetical protein